jgi:hypothetical protein
VRRIRAFLRRIAGLFNKRRRDHDLNAELEKLARCETFMSMMQRPARGMAVVVRTSSDPLKLASLICGQVSRRCCWVCSRWSR